MGAKVAPTSTQWPQFMASHSSVSSSHKPAPVVSSSTFTAQRNKTKIGFVYRSTRFGSCRPSKVPSSRSSDNLVSRSPTVRRTCSARLKEFSDEDLNKQIDTTCAITEIFSNSRHREGENSANMGFTNFFSPFKVDYAEPPVDWPGRDEVILASIERKANRFDIPLSIRIIKKKQQLEEGFREAGDFGYCSVNKAFSSMVFIIRELQSHALQTREILSYEDLQAILTQVQRDMNASFVWLFQKVFSGTPTLMVYMMILLANFTVLSMDHNTAIAASTPPRIVSHAAMTETLSVIETTSQQQSKLNSSAVKTLTGGNNGGGGGAGKVRAVASRAEGGERQLGLSSPSIQYPNVVPDEKSLLSSNGNDDLTGEEEVILWNSLVEEASRMQLESRGELLDHDTIQWFVSPVSVELEPDDYVDYFRTELLYQMGLSQEPNNPLLLSNYAQFLFLVARDHDRAEECFKRAVQAEPPDAEALSRYANFLWIARKDLWGAEERYQQAMAAEPDNPYHASNYASFLWGTGGEDTCFLLSNDKNNTIV